MTESEIIKVLWNQYGAGQTAGHNMYYYAFESDFLVLRDSGTVIEYEIKLSKSDYNAGLKKRQCLHRKDKKRRVKMRYSGQKPITRHEYLQAGYGANMFYYVAPESVLNSVDLPEWAGFIEARERGDGRIATQINKRAPKLHKKKASDNLKKKILTSIYYKYWHYTAKKVMDK